MSLAGKLRDVVYKVPTLRPLASRAAHRLSRLPGIETLHTISAGRQIARAAHEPPGMYLETTDICNAECITCPYPASQRPKEVMDMDLFRKIADDATSYGVRTFALHFLGEPLIDKFLFDRIRYLKAKSGAVSTWMNTNGSLLTEDKCRGLMDSGLDVLQISLDGHTKETFEKIRVGLTFEKVTENIERMMGLKRSRGAEKPHVRLYFVLTDANRAQVKALHETWGGRVDSISVVNAHNWASQTPDLSRTSPQLLAYPHRNPCAYLWRLMVVLCDGRVALCVMDSEGKAVMGDLKTQTVREVWEGEAFRRYREAHLEGARARMTLCSSCRQFSLWW